MNIWAIKRKQILSYYTEFWNTSHIVLFLEFLEHPVSDLNCVKDPTELFVLQHLDELLRRAHWVVSKNLVDEPPVVKWLLAVLLIQLWQVFHFSINDLLNREQVLICWICLTALGWQVGCRMRSDGLPADVHKGLLVSQWQVRAVLEQLHEYEFQLVISAAYRVTAYWIR